MNFVLAQVHGDPLFRIKDLRKLECFSRERFKELKGFFKGWKPSFHEVIDSGKRSKQSLCQDKTQQKVGDRGELSYFREGYDFSFIVSRKKDTWWEKENWGLVVNPENLWGDLSRDGENLLKSLLREH